MIFDAQVRRAMCKRQYTPFNNYIGQDDAVERLLDLVYQGYGDPDRAVRENIMLAGPPSTGKTTLAKMLAEEMSVNVVYTDSNQLNSGVTVGTVKVSGGADTVIHLILDAWSRTYHGPLEGVRAGSFDVYETPPVVFFIDEIHGLNRKTADALLKATERADSLLLGKDTVIDCKNVTWVGATTDWGKLPSAFRTRFTRIDLIPPTREEVAKIIKVNNPELDDDICRLIVFYGSSVPREALAFTRTVLRYADRNGVSHKEAVRVCAQREGIDDFGMRSQRVEILKNLNGSDGMNLRNLSAALSCEGEEMVKYWLPPMLFEKPPLVAFDKSKYRITDAGIQELSKRGIA